MSVFGVCAEEKQTKKSFQRAEKGKKFTLNSEVDFYCEVVDIDGCYFVNQNFRRCDYLFFVPSSKNKKTKLNAHLARSLAYFVELKGGDIESACEQLYNAIDRMKRLLPNCNIIAKVIGTKGAHPEIRQNEYYMKVRRLIKGQIEFEKVNKKNGFNHIEVLR